jgi:hypothetical protein
MGFDLGKERCLRDCRAQEADNLVTKCPKAILIRMRAPKNSIILGQHSLVLQKETPSLRKLI